MVQEITGTNKERYDKTIRRKEKFAVFLFDLAKASFTLMVIAGLWMFFTQGFTWSILGAVILGLLSTASFAFMANRVMIF